jgi:alkanesulfonate monooxygenase SsuD/methylene tetrahydromethanopterin reductase-like flavin-dependent oxidoreductase (luciferase family)
LAEVFEAAEAKAQWVENRRFLHLIQIGGRAPGEPFMEGWTVLSALAAVTSRVRLASLATWVGYRNPAHIAKIAAGVDLVTPAAASS